MNSFLHINIFQIIIGVMFAAGVTLAAWRAGALTISGALAACLVGAIIFGAGGWRWAWPLLLFFGTSSALSRWRRTAKKNLGYEKGGRRDAWQVGANGGVATLCALLPHLFSGVSLSHAHLLFLSALAAANADTWGTEIGSALQGKTYDLRTGWLAPPGTSGGVSLGGTLAALAGAALIGLCAVHGAARILVTLAGLVGALGDSLLGAVAQAQWRDPVWPGHWTERPQPGPPIRGWRWVSNDMVNLACTLLAVVITDLYDKNLF